MKVILFVLAITILQIQARQLRNPEKWVEVSQEEFNNDADMKAIYDQFIPVYIEWSVMNKQGWDLDWRVTTLYHAYRGIKDPKEYAFEFELSESEGKLVDGIMYWEWESRFDQNTYAMSEFYPNIFFVPIGLDYDPQLNIVSQPEWYTLPPQALDLGVDFIIAQAMADGKLAADATIGEPITHAVHREDADFTHLLGPEHYRFDVTIGDGGTWQIDTVFLVNNKGKQVVTYVYSYSVLA